MASKEKTENITMEFHDLCWYATGDNEESWNKIRKWLQNNSENALFKEAATYQNKYNRTPLHILLFNNPPLDVIETFVAMLVQHAPEALKLKDDMGNLPIHIACEFGGALVHSRNPMVDETKKSIESRIKYECQSLDVAYCNNQFLEILDILLQAYPDSLDVPCPRGKPSQVLKRAMAENNNSESNSDDEYIQKYRKDESKRVLILHEASAGGYSILLIKLLLEVYPESCITKDSDGKTPLHYACANQETDSVDIVMSLLTAHPESSLVQDKHGRTPLPSKKIIKAAAHKDVDGKVVFHHQAEALGGISDLCLNFLFKAYPEGITIPDNNGMLPFHHACLNTATSIESLMLFLKLYPESVVFLNEHFR